MPYYCTVPRCTSMAGKAKNVSFHQFPRDEELAKLWNKILKRGKPYTKYSKVCSLHFTPEDYTITSVGKNKGQWRTLRKDAIPSQNLPSESPTPYQRKQWGSWSQNTPANVLDPTIHQQVAQAIYMQTMLAMQAAGATEPPFNHNGLPQVPATTDSPLPHTSTTQDTDILRGKRTNTNEKSNSYKCTECSKCFKDPDVFILHKRSHIKNEKNEKENFNLNVTLQANPILANLLKTNTENTNIFDNNLISVESLLMTALAANMEGYMRNFTSMIKGDNRGDLNRDRGDLNRDRGSLGQDRGHLNHDSNLDLNSYSQNRLEQSDNYIQNGDNTSQRDSLSCDRSLNHDRGVLNHDSADSNHDGNNRDSNSNLFRDRIMQLYRNNDAYHSDRNIRYYENDSENNDGGSQNSDVTSYDDRGLVNRDRGKMNHDRGVMDDDRGVIDDDRDVMGDDRGVIEDDRGVIEDDRGVMDDDRGVIDDDRGYIGDDFTNDDDSQASDAANCDSDLNESIDSNKLVIDETI